MMGVSVIIPCRNQAATLERAVKSAFAAGADEVLVFDDASTDDTYVQYNPYFNTIKGKIFFHHSNFRAGVAYARNFLIHYAQTDWIIPLDADDELLEIPDELENYPSEFYYGGWVEHYADEHEETFTAPPAGMINRKPLCHATVMFTKQAWLEVGGYDPDFFFGEDYAFQCALVHAGWNAVHCDIPLYKRYVGNNPRTDKAVEYWPIIQEMCKEKYPLVFS